MKFTSSNKNKKKQKWNMKEKKKTQKKKQKDKYKKKQSNQPKTTTKNRKIGYPISKNRTITKKDKLTGIGHSRGISPRTKEVNMKMHHQETTCKIRTTTT